MQVDEEMPLWATTARLKFKQKRLKRYIYTYKYIYLIYETWGNIRCSGIPKASAQWMCPYVTGFEIIASAMNGLIFLYRLQ